MIYNTLPLQRRKPIEFPLSVLAVGEAAEAVQRPACPYQGCRAKLRWAPLASGERGLVCETHGVVWRSQEE
jgi:hypothetical protein